MLVVDDVDLRVVGDRLQRDVRHALVDEAVTDVAVRRSCHTNARPLTSAFLAKPVGNRRASSTGIGAHDAGARQGERDARRVDRDPASAPLLGDVCGRS